MNQELPSHPTNAASPRPAWHQTPLGVAGAMAALILTFYLLREHWHHIAGYWSYLLLLACPLMHLFHGGHLGHTHAPGGSENEGR